MGKSLYIAEKPSVAKEFAKALKYNMKNRDGYLESDEAVVTWCVGHLVTMSYPEAYDEKYKRWSLETIPFIPEEFKYEVIDSVKKQFGIVSGLLNREDVETIYVCTDSGREENTSIAWWSSRLALRGRREEGSGSIPRRRKKFCGASRKRRISRLMIICQTPLICGQKRIILWESIFPEHLP